MSSRSHDTLLVEAAARNNALWCDAVCRAYGAPGEFTTDSWLSRHQPPPFYGNLVTLTAGGTAEQTRRVHELLDRGLGWRWGLKDSFRRLDLEPLGFERLFDGTWLALPLAIPSPTVASPELSWARVSSASELAAWERAWRTDPANAPAAGEPRIFRPAILDDPTLAFLTVHRQGCPVAVAACNRTGEVVGLSNVFTLGNADEGHRAMCVAAARSVFPGRSLVGYEAGQDLAAFLELGFEPIGPLRVWLRSG